MNLLTATYGCFFDIWDAIRVAFIPTTKAILARPSMLLTPRTISRVFMDAVWSQWSTGTDAGARPTKEKLLKENDRVRGVVFDVGAGHGSLVYYLDRSRVMTYAALEPNTFMHEHIRKAANKEGYSEEDGSLLIIPYGVEQTEKIREELKAHYTKFRATLASSDALTQLANGQVATIVSILSFCSIPNPQQSITSLISHVLAPGGTLFFYEHVMNPIPSVARLQRILGKIWIVFLDGCVMGQDTVRMVREAGDSCGGWESVAVVGKEGEDVESLFFHAVGTCVKKS